LLYVHRAQIATDIQEFNCHSNGTYPDVSLWPIKKYDMARQTDE